MRNTIRVVNIRTYSGPKGELIMRGSPLGNGNHLFREADRLKVIKQFKQDLWKKIKAKDPKICGELRRLVKLWKDTGHINLVCCCKPKPCHGDVVKDCLIWIIENNIKL